MDRRKFLKNSALLSGAAVVSGSIADACKPDPPQHDWPWPTPSPEKTTIEKEADLVIIGGGMGGVAAALAACRNGLSVIMTEETAWIGGQASQQGVPLDEHKWIETTGAPRSYRQYRNNIRNFYKSYYPVADKYMSDPLFNPGEGGYYRLGHEPRVSYSAMSQMLLPYEIQGRLTVMKNTKAVSASMDGQKVSSVTVKSVLDGDLAILHAPTFIDATELGDLLPMTGTEYVTGSESKAQTGELHAGDKADPTNNQAWTYVLGFDYLDGEDHTIEKPREYDFWKNYVPKLTPAWAPGKLFNENYSAPDNPAMVKKAYFNPLTSAGEDGFSWWLYRKVINAGSFVPGTFPSDITMLNWPQNDYYEGNLIDVSEEEFKAQVEHSKQLSLSFLYWLQTECPRRDGKTGWPGIRMRGDLFDTKDGLALYPYIRESRRIKAMTTILEEHIGQENRKLVSGDSKAFQFWDSVGLGYYHLDLHPSFGGDNTIDTPSLPFQIPLGAMIPIRTANLIPACKNIGTTHITNGCYRLHPVEWSIGEAAGCLAAFIKKNDLTPRTLWEQKDKVAQFQEFINAQGVETVWKV